MSGTTNTACGRRDRSRGSLLGTLASDGAHLRADRFRLLGVSYGWLTANITTFPVTPTMHVQQLQGRFGAGRSHHRLLHGIFTVTRAVARAKSTRCSRPTGDVLRHACCDSRRRHPQADEPSPGPSLDRGTRRTHGPPRIITDTTRAALGWGGRPGRVALGQEGVAIEDLPVVIAEERPLVGAKLASVGADRPHIARAFGPHRRRRQSQPALMATEGYAASPRCCCRTPARTNPSRRPPPADRSHQRWDAHLAA